MENKLDLVALKKAAEGATPGPWKVKPIKGYTDDYVVTEHPDYQQKPHGAHIAEVGYAAGHTKQNFQENARFIALANPTTILSLLAENERMKEAILHLKEARDASCERLQKFLDTFDDLGDSATSASISDWLGYAKPSSDELLPIEKFVRAISAAPDQHMKENRG
jgi:hypothetical protein